MTAVIDPGQLRPETVDRAAEALRVYEAERAGLVRRAARFGGGRDQGEDAVQDAFVRLLTNAEEVRDAAAFVRTHAKYRALDESVFRGRQVPVGDAMDLQPDTAPPAEDLDTVPACMGDPAVAKAVDEALAKLPERQARAIRLHLLEGRKVSEIAPVLGVDKTTVYTYLNVGLETLRRMDVAIPGEEPETPAGKATAAQLVATLDREHPGQWVGPVVAHETLRRVHGSCSAARSARAQQVHNAPLTPPMRVRAGKGVEAMASANVELVETLGREFPGRAVTIAEAEQTLRRVHGSCSLWRAREARTKHNAKVPVATVPNGTVATTVAAPEPASLVTTESSAAGAMAAATDPAGSVVAEVWLMGAKPPISCLLVHTDETTGSRGLAAVSMAGAQREITGQLIADGYRPDGPWVDVDPAGPEAMRKFQTGA